MNILKNILFSPLNWGIKSFGIGDALSLGSSLIGAFGSKSAGDEAAESQEQALQLNKELYDQALGEIKGFYDESGRYTKPYRGVGYNALYGMSDMLGLPRLFGSPDRFTDFRGIGAKPVAPTRDQFTTPGGLAGLGGQGGAGGIPNAGQGRVVLWQDPESGAMLTSPAGAYGVRQDQINLQNNPIAREMQQHMKFFGNDPYKAFNSGLMEGGIDPSGEGGGKYDYQGLRLSYGPVAQQAQASQFDQSGYNAAQAQYKKDLADYNRRLAAYNKGEDPYEVERYNWQQSPSYQWRFNEGQRATDRAMAQMGNRISGNRLHALQEYGQNMASQEFGAQFGRLAQLAGWGLQAASQQSGNAITTGANIGQTLGTQAGAISGNLGLAGQYRAAGTLGASQGVGQAIGGLGGFLKNFGGTSSTATRYGTTPGSQQTRMLQEQDSGLF